MAAPAPTSKADVAYAEIRQQILDGRLQAGSKLAQYALADAMGISITPLREAVRRLSGEGWIVLDTHRNARVAGLDLDGAGHVLEVRRALEPAAAALAASRRSDEDVAALRVALRRLVPVTRATGDAALVAHRDVHRALYCASHNEVMIRVIDDLWDRSDRYRRVGLQLPIGNEPRTRDFDDHHELVELVVAGEADAAAALMARHIDGSLTATALQEQHRDDP